jgi:hypothetical protein
VADKLQQLSLDGIKVIDHGEGESAVKEVAPLKPSDIMRVFTRVTG